VTLAVTHIGTATILLEVAGLRLLTDPVFDAPGRTYGFGFGTRSTRLEAAALTVEAVGRIDAVLLSHDQHADNFDDAGRALLPKVPVVVTTTVAAKRLGHPGAKGLADFEAHSLGDLKITATPARHGPPGSLPVAGHVIGFMLEHPSLTGPIYISGDTVWFKGIAEVARRFQPAIAFLHLGGVRFPISGPLTYTFDAAQAVRAARALGAKRVIPLHFEGWTHFRQPRAEADQLLRSALGERLQWLERGVRTLLDAS
jgi:L-ascorbate metabolism protein UlaG (beta-lactamase superfamily)